MLLDTMTIYAPPSHAAEILFLLEDAGCVFDSRLVRGVVTIDARGALSVLTDLVPALRSIRSVSPSLDWSFV